MLLSLSHHLLKPCKLCSFFWSFSTDKSLSCGYFIQTHTCTGPGSALTPTDHPNWGSRTPGAAPPDLPGRTCLSNTSTVQRAKLKTLTKTQPGAKWHSQIQKFNQVEKNAIIPSKTMALLLFGLRICAMLEFCTKSFGTDILAHGTEISAPGSVNQQLLTYPDPARHADLPGGFNQLRSHQNIETINYHPLFDSAAKVPRLQRVEYLKSSHQTAASRYFTPSASVHQNGSKSPSGCRPAAPRSAPNERGNRPGKRNLWAKEFHFPSFHLCCNKAGCG